MTSPAPGVLFARINAALPQTQCTRCGYPDCAAYAQAIAAGQAAINQCPPGGMEGVERLASITGLPVLPLNPANGLEGPRYVAVIEEAWCIGCTLCIKACPTDAILGSNKVMHTVIEPYCTGCELCVPVCPVDCISLENVTGPQTGWNAWSEAQAATALDRYIFHSVRLKNSKDAGDEMPEEPGQSATLPPDLPVAQATQPDAPATAADRKRSVIEAALARARTRREAKA
ncbi:MAG: electron transport complex, RnfABCDGE type, subunit [Polaromonas sp.]|nr:electron transport complex, RnfABCDGE type, subunit [Polaromonas sp.]